MGTVLAQKIIDDAGDILNDPTHANWKEARLLKWLNLGQIEASILKPDISVGNESVQLAAGTKQDSSGFQLVNITRNMGSDGLTPGLPVTKVDSIEVMDYCVPTWHTDATNVIVKHFLFDPRDPDVFYTYPPQPSSNMGYVEIVKPVVPTAIALIGDPITVGDINEPALLSFVLSMAYSEDAAHTPLGRQRAVDCLQKFEALLTKKDLREVIDAPVT